MWAKGYWSAAYWPSEYWPQSGEADIPLVQFPFVIEHLGIFLTLRNTSGELRSVILTTKAQLHSALESTDGVLRSTLWVQ